MLTIEILALDDGLMLHITPRLPKDVPMQLIIVPNATSSKVAHIVG